MTAKKSTPVATSPDGLRHLDAQARSDEPAGALAGSRWVRFIPTVLLRAFFRFAVRDPRRSKRYGVVLVSNVGRFGSGPGWGVPPGGPTLVVTVGAWLSVQSGLGQGSSPANTSASCCRSTTT